VESRLVVVQISTASGTLGMAGVLHQPATLIADKDAEVLAERQVNPPRAHQPWINATVPGLR